MGRSSKGKRQEIKSFGAPKTGLSRTPFPANGKQKGVRRLRVWLRAKEKPDPRCQPAADSLRLRYPGHAITSSTQ